MYTPPVNIPTVNHTITQDPYTKEYTINIAIKIKPETVIKEIRATTLGPTNYSSVAPLQPLDLTNVFKKESFLEPSINASKLNLSGFETLDLSFLNKNPLPAINPLDLQKLQGSLNTFEGPFNKNHPYF